MQPVLLPFEYTADSTADSVLEDERAVMLDAGGWSELGAANDRAYRRDSDHVWDCMKRDQLIAITTRMVPDYCTVRSENHHHEKVPAP